MNRQESQMPVVDDMEQNNPAGEKAADCKCNQDDPASGCLCCGMTGRGGKFRIGLMVTLAIVIVVLLVQGFASAG